MRYHLSSSKTERFADLCSQVRELKKEAREKNGYDLVAILVDDRKAGSSESTSASGSRQVSVEHANIPTGSSNRLRTGRQVLTDDESVLGDETPTTSSNSAISVDDLYRKGGSDLPRYCERRYMNEVRGAIIERAADVGFIIESKTRLPWKRLPKLCAQHGVYIDNYPDGIISPFGTERNGGIKTFTNGEREAMLHALMSEKNHPMQFLSESSPSDILNNRQPVIVYAPPPSCSPYERSKRIFLDESYDYQGHPRIGSLPASGKTARKRCVENPSAHRPEKRRRLNEGIQGSQPGQPPIRTLAPVHPTTGTAKTRSSAVEISDDFLRTMEGRLFNYVFTYAERTMHGRDASLNYARR